MPSFNKLIRLAEDLAHKGAKSLAKDIIKYQEIEFNLARDVKIIADKQLEELIVSGLLEKANYPVLSEESGVFDDIGRDDGYIWIVDPLDGSMNFSRGIPINCISIALWKGMQSVLGVIYDFNRNEMFSGLVGQGAWLNGKPINVSNTKKKSSAILCTGFPVSSDFSSRTLLRFVENIMEYKKIRLLGSAALSLSYVACGRADVYMENGIKIWDVAAGIAIAKAAGGVAQYSCLDVGNNNILTVKVSNGYLANC
jgi:myo-inositol-1(or 4)-monophosphatase